MNEFTRMHRAILSFVVLITATVSLTGCQDLIASQQPTGEHKTHRQALAADHEHASEHVGGSEVLLDHVENKFVFLGLFRRKTPKRG